TTKGTSTANNATGHSSITATTDPRTTATTELFTATITTVVKVPAATTRNIAEIVKLYIGTTDKIVLSIA
ncbi:MAG TPA: hypothetical protein VJ799_11620, partial [Nitrososphaeraceae archaeon]|nr:hypothetical protein [Nitrososphaeraceae archaeon]